MKIMQKLTAMLCTGLLLTAVPCTAVSAEEDTFRLPSGKSIAELDMALCSLAARNNDGEDYYAAALCGVFQGDDILYENYFGKSDIAGNIPADENVCFEWGSISKTLIWVSAFQLWEHGKLDLERDVREYLPEGFFCHLSYDEPITMYHLMNHSAGWQETTRPIWKTDENDIQPLKAELQAIEPAQISRPGEVVAYSNYGAAVAGYVIECVSGQDYCDYVHEHIFEPLGMEHTALLPAHSDNAFVCEQRRKMHSYSVQPLLSKAIDLGTKLAYVPAYPAGAACGTLRDMIRYGQALADESAPLFANPETQRELLSGTDFYGTSDIPMNCHGFWCQEHAVRTYGHSGGTVFGQANLEFDPVTKIGFAVMVNEPGGNDFLNNMGDLVFGTLPADTYGAASQGRTEVSGYFLPARSTHQGMLRFIPYLSALSSEMLNLRQADNIGSDVIQITHTDRLTHQESAGILGLRRAADGRLLALETPSCDCLADPFYLFHLMLLTGFVLGGVSSVYLMLIRSKLKRAGRWTSCVGANAKTAGRAARLISLLLVLTTYVVYVQYHGGIPKTAGLCIGVLQMLCVGVLVVAAVICVAAVLVRKEKPLRCIPHAAVNLLSVCAILFFQMYRFWNM
ncbi:MAG: beta-lactamase family protein [Oscillospiraceae bacterium]|nr:beta-lactamase family protein [Oscillospiraceae bacterium]